MRKLLDKVGLDAGRKFEYLLNTGNLVSKSGLDLSQASGFTVRGPPAAAACAPATAAGALARTLARARLAPASPGCPPGPTTPHPTPLPPPPPHQVVAEKLNFFRYLSHFRSVHRGAYFTEMRTTTVRKLLPESWGFMCPVHTPDGSPCGLLNHLAAAARVVTADPADPERTAVALAQVRRRPGAAWGWGGGARARLGLWLGGLQEPVPAPARGAGQRLRQAAAAAPPSPRAAPHRRP